MTPTTRATLLESSRSRSSECGMSLLAIMAIMTLFAIALLAVAPTVQVEVQREKELETIRRGEEVAEAIRQYVEFYRGAKLPNSIDDLLDGLPQGTKTRRILRQSAAVDPLSPDGKWGLVKVDPQVLARFARRVQNFNNGLLPSNPGGGNGRPSVFDRYSVVLVNSINDATDTESQEPDEESDLPTDNTPFIGVVSQSRNRSVLTYYGTENHSKWIFTPMFRGTGASRIVPQSTPIRNPVSID